MSFLPALAHIYFRSHWQSSNSIVKIRRRPSLHVCDAMYACNSKISATLSFQLIWMPMSGFSAVTGRSWFAGCDVCIALLSIKLRSLWLSFYFSVLCRILVMSCSPKSNSNSYFFGSDYHGKVDCVVLNHQKGNSRTRYTKMNPKPKTASKGYKLTSLKSHLPTKDSLNDQNFL